MPRHPFRILNVFADSPLSGNALAVFEDGRGLSDERMQALALQFNLSETTFLFPSSVATARVRIFSPSFEMPFAGHPTLGTAHVARSLFGGGDTLTLEMRAGIIPVTATHDTWTLRANPPVTRPTEASQAELASMLGLHEEDVRDGALWVDTGSEQLIVRLTTPEAIGRCRPDASLMARHASNREGAGLVYVWAHEDVPPTEAGEHIVARFFFLKHGAVIEDPGTGSACANLGGWFVARSYELPMAAAIDQGEPTGRPCKLGLRVDAAKQIFVTGKVIEIGRGEITV
jgi:trans-2,3-dihydro-3-hydroxyanthranilate isomerase